MKRNGYIAPLILSTVTLTVIVFLIWELLQKNFFAGLDTETIHFLYISRGVALGAVLTVWSVWFVLKHRIQYEGEQRNLQAQLFQSEKLAALGELIGGVAHEINNPAGVLLSRIDLMVEDARDQNLPAKHIEDLEVLRKHAIRIGTIARNLLRFSRKSGADWAEVDLNAVVNTTVSLMDWDLTHRKISLQLLLGEGLPRIAGNFNQLQQVVLNLLTNARHALLEANGSVLGPRILVRTWKEPLSGQVRLCVIDNGPGIPTENVGRVFDPFFTTKETGTGLGLSVSYGIVKEHGGTLSVASDGKRKPCGTCFMLSLPVAKGKA